MPILAHPPSALYRLRGALRRDGEKTKFVAVRTRRYRLERDRFDLDVERFERRLAHARERDAAGERAGAERAYRDALALYRGDYFADLDAPWLLPERQRLRDAHLDALSDLAALLENAGDLDGALETTRTLLRCDPLHEPAHRRAMRLLHRLGDRRGVTRQYRELRGRLEAELALAPLPETERLYRELAGGT